MSGLRGTSSAKHTLAGGKPRMGVAVDWAKMGVLAEWGGEVTLNKISDGGSLLPGQVGDFKVMEPGDVLGSSRLIMG